ncbi:MAG TPA: glycosyltransferase family 4 protein [Propionibacteriaceae bacterium]|nr:glycosyltransferase family 4 protein [Propionibacteriaceae bacterium]
MRVGLVCPYDLRAHGGVQAQVLGLARWLTESGHEAYVLAPGTLTDERLAESGLPAARVASTGGSVAVPYNGSVARIACGPLSSRRVRRWLAQSDLDLLHVHEPITPSASALAMRATDLPIVATFHSATPGSRGMAAAGRLFPDTVARIDEGIAVSRVAADVVDKHLGLRPRVIGNGIRLEDFSIPQPAGRWRGGDRPRVTFVGRLRERRKGLAVLLAAVDDIVRQHPDVDICVAGAGVPIPAGRNVRYVGELTNCRRNELLATSDVFVAPHTGRESFGIVLLEALASGATVVASDLPAFVELLTDGAGAAGRVVATESSKALAEGVSQALHQPEPPSRGRALAARYDWDVIGPKVLGTYEDALGTSAAGRRTG